MLGGGLEGVSELRRTVYKWSAVEYGFVVEGMGCEKVGIFGSVPCLVVWK